MRLIRLASTLVLAGGLLAAVPPSYAEEPAPLRITVPHRLLPVSVPTEEQNPDVYPRELSFTVTGTPGTDVTVTFVVTGMIVRAPVALTLDSHGTGRASTGLIAPEPGLHQLTASVATDDGAQSASVTLPYLFTPGGDVPAVDGHDTLVGRAFSYHGTTQQGESTYDRYADLVWFLADGLVTTAPVGSGRPTCTQQGPTCEHYSYDAASGLVQIGADVIAKIDDKTAYLVDVRAEGDDGWGGWDTGTANYVPLAELPAGYRTRGVWVFPLGNSAYGFSYARLRLTRGGHYDLHYVTTDDGYSEPARRHSSGRYRVRPHGAMLLRYRGGKAQHHRPMTKVVTLLAGATHTGEPDPGVFGIWMGITTASAGEDGDLLEPV